MEIPKLFVSKKHFICFIVLILVFIAIIALELVLAINSSWHIGLTTIFSITVLLVMIVLFLSIEFPIYYIEYKASKNNDYIIIKNFINKSLNENINNEKKNYLRMILLRYAVIYNIDEAKLIAKEIFIPDREVEKVHLTYYKSMLEYYAAIGADKRFKEIIDSMNTYKVPKIMYNKYELFYLLMIGEKITDKDIEVFDFSSYKMPDNVLSLFSRGIHYKNNKDTHKLEIVIKKLDEISQDNCFSKILKGLI